MSKANLIYFGSPGFSAQILESILKNKSSEINVVGVVTQPDTKVGRDQKLTPSSVAQVAGGYDLPVFKPIKLDDSNLSHLKLLKPDIFLVVSYGKIIPKSWLATPSIGTFNLHFSLLPKYRGALCISEAVRNQDQVTGVTLMAMSEGLDQGPLIQSREVNIDIDDNVESLTTKLTRIAILLLGEYLPLLANKKFSSNPQNNDKATLTPTTKTRNRDSAFIGWSVIQKALIGEDATKTHALIRSLNPDPGAWTKVDNLEIKLIQTHLNQKENKLSLEIVQVPGKKPISWSQFQIGHSI